MANTIPSDTHAAGDTGHISDHNNIADVLTMLNTLKSGDGLALAPTGATGETRPRMQVTTTSSAMTSGTVYVMPISLPTNLLISNITTVTGGTAKTGGTHGWVALLDSGRAVRAVSADQTDAATTWGTINTTQTLSVAGSAYTTTYNGLYYVALCVVATGMPLVLAAASPSTVTGGLAPVLYGTSSTGQTTPPALATVMTAITASNTSVFYAYTS